MTGLDLVAGSLCLTAACGLLAGAALRWAPRLLPGGPRAASEIFLRAFLVATLAAVLSVALSGFLGVLSGWTLLASALAFYAAARLSQARPAPFRAGVTGRRMGLLWPVALAAVFAAVCTAVFLPASPVNWDAMTYHLYFPARWIEEGRLFHVPTVFSDESSAFAPQNGALFFAWQMALLGHDATTNVCQVPCLVFLAVALYRMALLLGIRRRAALMAAALLVWLPPLWWTFSADVDVFMLAFWTGAVYWLWLYLERREWGSLLACGLASGLAAGTKVLGLPLAAVPAGVLTVHLLVERRWKRLAAFAAAAAGGGGWWYLRNLWLYANPLFPLDFGVGGLRFAGVYTAETLRRGSLFHIAEARDWLSSVDAQIGTASVLLFAAGLAGLAWRLRGGGRRRAPPLAALGFAASWTWYVFAVVPHNNQPRFLLPSFVAVALGWAAWLDAAASRWVRGGLFLLGVAALVSVLRPELRWAYQLGRLEASGVDAASWMALSASLAAAAVWALKRTPLCWAVTVAGIAFAAVAGLAAHDAERSRIAFLADADYQAWAAGYLMFNEPFSPPRRIAYSGLNIPYALSGASAQNAVVYCNTQGGPDDGVYEFWKKDRRLSSMPSPGLYRGDDNFGVWSSCLRERRVDTVVVFALIPVERRPGWRLSNGFPIEREWMLRRPESFKRILASGRAEIYEVVGPAGRP